ncbi:MAG: dihydrofolate reductase [Ignavibacteria bacterium]|jgi:dihydrofolate reductase|nr:dihydrofolate reductase [Ignavibacteria bacterium]MCU7499551.1 dihydrofolate reductase [Ignavibacteria bacterium]MCU7512339.1 dihydrofolate reductase [Ignavibacteria bacterium]MCU7519563.1 dihydrofolate reductase [Ignavibacteria bacterium]MCU7524527.1 dihydrofolate reductase [Ignavibacteria bacterium]
MSKLKVLCFGVSVDGFGAGAGQSLENPMGNNGMALHEWFFPTNTFQKMHGQMQNGDKTEGILGIDDDFADKGFHNIGAWIMGRNMFTPERGPWKDFSWKGWWGENPPYHTSVYVLTHYARPPIEMAGGTTFYFVTDGIETALEMAKEKAGGKDIRLGGGVETVKQYLKAKLLDEMHIAIAPVLLNSGENLFTNVNLNELGYKCVEFTPSKKALHLVFKKYI